MAKEIYGVPTNWVMVPAAQKMDAPSTDDQQWIMTLSGIAEINFRGISETRWRQDVFRLHVNWNSPVATVYQHPQPDAFRVIFQVMQWAPFATINSISTKPRRINGGNAVYPKINEGYAVDSCKPVLVDQYNWEDFDRTNPIRNTFDGLNVGVAVRGANTYVHKIGFQVTLLGKVRVVHVRAGM